MAVVKWSEAVEGLGDKIDDNLCGVLYNEEDESIFTGVVTDPYANINCFTLSKEDNYWILPKDHYNKDFKNWKVPINHCQLHE